MIQKKNLLSGLDQLITNQKALVPLLNRHVTASLEMSGLKGSVQKEVSDQLQRLAMTQNRHLEVLEAVRKHVEESNRDVH